MEPSAHADVSFTSREPTPPPRGIRPPVCPLQTWSEALPGCPHNPLVTRGHPEMGL